MSNAIREDRHESAVTCELIKATEFQKEGSVTAQLRQKHTTVSWYPSKQATNSKSDSLFSNDEYGYGEQSFESVENRVAFMNVPVGTTMEIINSRLDATPKARIYRELSNHPILTTSQAYAISEGLKTKNEFANSQVARYGENHPKAGELVTKDGKPMYRVTFFSTEAKADVDSRTSDPNDYYSTPEIEMELTGEINVGNEADLSMLPEVAVIGEQAV